MSNRRKATPAELEFITAAREGDRDRLHDALVEMQRDPKRWFCSATDEETGIPRVYGRGDARAEVEANVRSGVSDSDLRPCLLNVRITRKRPIRHRYSITSSAPPSNVITIVRSVRRR